MSHTPRTSGSTLVQLPDGNTQVTDHDTGRTWVGRKSGACIFANQLEPDGTRLVHDTIPGATQVHRPLTSSRVKAAPPANDAVLRARVPADLKVRLDRAGEHLGGASHVLRALLEQGLSDIEAHYGEQIEDEETRARYVALRLHRKAKAAKEGGQ